MLPIDALPELPKQAKSLVADGIWAMYEVSSSTAPFFLRQGGGAGPGWEIGSDGSVLSEGTLDAGSVTGVVMFRHDPEDEGVRIRTD